ncbi:MAG: hypothetical protein CEN87_555 [Parcubacteria group bacterium Licking1014_1]|nr:MAG: hypothetical protein CEN87_555 [Parcubacteria group bacterium Licking1014_1]
MKNKLKEIIPIFIIVYCLIIVPIFLYKYSLYLEKPNDSDWDQVKKYLVDSKKYNKEPIVFNPGWLKNYATDYGRFKNFNISKTKNDSKNYWLIATEKKSVPKNHRITEKEEIENLFIFKLKKIEKIK